MVFSIQLIFYAHQQDKKKFKGTNVGAVFLEIHESGLLAKTPSGLRGIYTLISVRL